MTLAEHVPVAQQQAHDVQVSRGTKQQVPEGVSLGVVLEAVVEVVEAGESFQADVAPTLNDVVSLQRVHRVFLWQRGDTVVSLCVCVCACVRA